MTEKIKEGLLVYQYPSEPSRVPYPEIHVPDTADLTSSYIDATLQVIGQLIQTLRMELRSIDALKDAQLKEMGKANARKTIATIEELWRSLVGYGYH